MAGPTIAVVNVDVTFDQDAAVAQAKRIGDKVGDAMGEGAAKGGGPAGDKFASNFDKSLSGRFKRIGSKIDNQLLDAFDGAGKNSGGAFAGGFNKSVFTGMDRTVALVIKLIAAIGPQMAALGSALSANVVAILSSSLLGLVGAMAALVPVAIAAGGGLALLITGFKEMKKSTPGLQKAMDGLSGAWKEQANTLGRQVGPALKNLITDLTAAMKASDFGRNIGASMGAITAAFNDVVKSAGFTSFMREMSDVIPSALTGFGVGIAKLTEALLTMFGQVGPLAANLGSDFAAWASGIADAANTAASNQGFATFFNNAYNSLQLLLGVLGPLGKALFNVFEAGQPSGDRLLGTLGGLAQKFLDWTNSIGGQNALAEWFSQGEGIFNRVIDVIGVIGTTLADLVTPQTISSVEQFLDNLKLIIPAVGELLATIGTADALNIFANALIGVLDALNPVLPLLQELAGVIANLPPETIQAIATAFAILFAAFKVGALVSALGSLKLLSTLILQLRTAPTIIAALRGAWIALAASFSITPIGLLITAIVALVAGLVYFFTQTETGKKIVQDTWEGIQAAASAVASWFTGTFLPGLTAVWDSIVAGVQAVGDFFGTVWQGILDAPQNVVNWFTGTFVPFMQSLPGLLLTALIEYVQFWISLPGRIIGALASLIAFLIEWGANAAVALITWVTEAIPKMVTFFAELPGKIINGIAQFSGMLVGWITDAWNAMYDFVVGAFVAYITFWAELPGKTVAAVQALLPLLGAFFGQVWANITTSVTTGIENVRRFFSELPSKIMTALGSLLGTIGRIFTDAMGEGNRAAVEGVGKLLTTMGEIPGKILTAVGSLAKTLYNAGRDVVQGLVDGVASMAGAVGREVNKIISGLSAGVKKLLGISSPSKVFADIGRNVMRGLEVGISANGSMPNNALAGVARDLTNQIGPLGNIGIGASGVSGANTGGGSGRTLSVAPGAIVVNVPTENPEQAANAVLDRLVARWK